MTLRKAQPLTANPVHDDVHIRTPLPWVVKVTAILVFVILILAALTRIAAAQSGAWATIIREGAEEYKENCAACHGADAKGGGDLGQKLFKKPNDLTELAKRNGGTFSFRRVYDVIAGDQPVEGHDTMHMPKYADRMTRDDFRPGYHRAHLRILELAHYLESIQVK